MKFAIVLVALFVLAAARPNDEQIVRSESDVQPDGFKFVSETSDGTSHSAEGQLKDKGSDHESIVVHGQFSWKDKDGQVYTTTYTADENGFQPQGAHLPVA